jgi:hypothetical protein
MDYQLVLQFKTTDPEEIDWLLTIQEDLHSMFGDRHLVDGNDIGQGKLNIIIHTNYPLDAFEESKEAFDGSDLEKMIAAYRKMNDDEYKVIWPCCFKNNFELL